MDPRGSKVGGLETYIRDFIKFLPQGWTALLIGVDGVGDLPLGRVKVLEREGRDFLFLPIVHYAEAKQRAAAKSIKGSITFRFAIALYRYFRPIRALLKTHGFTVDLRRVEFSPFIRMTGRPFAQMLHGEGAPDMAMDSMLRKYSFVHNWHERFAICACRHLLCVNPGLVDRLRAKYPKHANKVGWVGTWADISVFRPSDFPSGAMVHLAFVGRLDDFKDPPLMFRTIAELRRRMPISFHYAGTSDPYRFAEFGQIMDITVLHGYLSKEGINSLLANCHAGLLCSHFEGMPRSVLETLACGRPVISTDLEQLRHLIARGKNGEIVNSRNPADLADAVARVTEQIRRNELMPQEIHRSMLSYTPEAQLSKMYDLHAKMWVSEPAPV
jgi:glycosyltransferase involved in cell wall biosynthesis